MKLLPTRYFHTKDLEPLSATTVKPQAVLPVVIIDRLEDLSKELQGKSIAVLENEYVERFPDVAVFISILHIMGAVRVVQNQDQIRLSAVEPLAGDLGRVLCIYLRYGFPIFDDWTRRHGLPDRLSAPEFLHHLELQRIEYSRRAGIYPEVLEEIPVAFAVIKGYSRKRREPVYLLELNKDWNRFSLVGGKQREEDGGDYHRTLLREIEEELGILRRDVLLTPLTDNPIEGYSLSGYRGILARYPCMLFLAKFSCPVALRPKDEWFTEAQIRSPNAKGSPDLMINPAYLEFLLNKGLPRGLDKLPYSVEDPVEGASWPEAARVFLVHHWQWIAGALIIIAATIGVIKAILS